MAVEAGWLEIALNEAKATFSREIQYLSRCIEEFLRDQDYKKLDHEFQKTYQTFVEVLPIIDQNFFNQIIQFTSSAAIKMPTHLSMQQQKVFFIVEFVKKLSNLAEEYELKFELTNLCDNLDNFIKTALDTTGEDKAPSQSASSKYIYRSLTDQAKNHNEELKRWLEELEKNRTSAVTVEKKAVSFAASGSTTDYQSHHEQNTYSIFQEASKAELRSQEFLKSSQTEALKIDTLIQAKNGQTTLSVESTITPAAIYFDETPSLKVSFTDPSSRNRKGQTALHLALEKKEKLEKIVTIITAGANIHASDEDGNSVMHYAMKYADAETINWFLERKVDVFAINHNNETLLHVYMRSNLKDLVILERLIKTGIDIKARDTYKNMSLHVAAEFGKVNFLQLFINRGVDINARGAHDSTPLHIAILNQQEEILLHLLEAKNINVKAQNKSGETFLHLGVKLEISALPIILQRFDLKDCINVLNLAGKTALDIALEKKNGKQVNEMNEEIIKVLKLKGAKRANDIKKTQGKTNNNFSQPMDVFSEILANKSNISALVSSLPSINIRNDQKQTLLHFTVLLDKKGEVAFLLKNRISISATSKNGNTVLHDAMIMDNNNEIILMLLSAGARLDIVNQQNLTPLHVAAIYRKYEKVKLIINTASDQAIKNTVNLQNADGNTVAHLLILHVERNETQTLLKVIKLLLDNHLLIHTRNAKGQNLLDCAQEQNNTLLINFLTGFYEPQSQAFQEETVPTHSP